MKIKKVNARKYFTYQITTTLNDLKSLVGQEVDLLYQEAARLGFKLTGPIEFIYFNCTNDVNKPFEFVLALPIEASKPIENPRYSLKEFGEFKCYPYIHHGDVSNLFPVYESVFQEVGKNGLKPANQIREVYEKFLSLESVENITEIQIGIE